MYEYVKGKGWIILSYDTHTFVTRRRRPHTLDRYKVTYIRRKPLEGERYFDWYKNNSLKELEARTNDWVHPDSGGTWNAWCESTPVTANHDFVVIKVEAYDE